MEQFIITKTTQSKLPTVDFNNLAFGKYFTDHLLEVNYINGAWQTPEIKQYGPILLDPAASCLHYGQEIFEGIKAEKLPNNQVAIFRPDQNLIRFNLSAERMKMPTIPDWIFIDGMKKLIEVDKDWVPNKPDHALYIRPYMFATEATLGVKPSNAYKFIIILSPVGPYFGNNAAPLKILVEETYTRAVKGGVGFSKNAGNYAVTLLPAKLANDKGYDQILWTDPNNRNIIQEVGMMNVMFYIGDTVYTPSLENGTILNGVTRNSVIDLLKKKNIPVIEKNITIQEIVAAYNAGILKEIFGTGTAAVILTIQELRYKDISMKFTPENWLLAPALKSTLCDIKSGKIADEMNWLCMV